MFNIPQVNYFCSTQIIGTSLTKKSPSLSTTVISCKTFWEYRYTLTKSCSLYEGWFSYGFRFLITITLLLRCNRNHGTKLANAQLVQNIINNSTHCQHSSAQVAVLASSNNLVDKDVINITLVRKKNLKNFEFQKYKYLCLALI